MIARDEDRMRGPFGADYEEDPRCEFCERSVVARFGGCPSVECQSCADEFERVATACGGMLEIVDE